MIHQDKSLLRVTPTWTGPAQNPVEPPIDTTPLLQG
jgi:hypothetical protein